MNIMPRLISPPARRTNLLSAGLTVSVIRLFLGLLLALGAVRTGQAQGLMGFAQMSSQPNGGAFDYTLTLYNTGTDPIGTFWFAWLPSGQNYLFAMPTAATAQTPSWVGYVMSGYNYGGGGYYYDYSIEYYDTSGMGLAPGNSMVFGFTSTDTPAALAGDSVYYPGIPVGTSYLYDTAFSEGFQLTVTPVPEPSPVALFALGGLGLMFAARRGLFQRPNRVPR